MHRRCCLLVTRMRWNCIPPHPGHQQAASSVHCTTSCKHSLVFLRTGEIITRNMLNWLKSFCLLVTRMMWNCIPPHPGHQQAASSVHCTTSCKHSLVFLRTGEIITRNMMNWLKSLIAMAKLIVAFRILRTHIDKHVLSGSHTGYCEVRTEQFHPDLAGRQAT